MWKRTLDTIAEASEGSGSISQASKSVTNEQTYHYRPLKEKENEIRIVTILPGVPDEEEIKCNLEHFPLSKSRNSIIPKNSKPGYEALSYVWGDVNKKVLIRLGSACLWVTENLAVALRYLRHPFKPRQFWIDAICIDQNNIAERAREVLRMSDIYGSAPTVIWLGPETATANEFFCLHETGDAEHSPDYGRLFGKLLVESGWIHRKWIIQEFALALRVEYACGTRRFRFWINSIYHYYGDEIRTGTGEREATGTFDRLCSLRSRVSSPRARIRHVSLGRLLQDFRHNRCSDSRDHIFALLGLVHDTLGIVPDYGRDPREVFTEITKKIIAESKRLELLEYVGGDEQDHLSQSNDLPSWVPDWSKPGFELKWPEERLFEVAACFGDAMEATACGNAVVDLDVLKDDSNPYQIQLRGILLDSIDYVVHPLLRTANAGLGWEHVVKAWRPQEFSSNFYGIGDTWLRAYASTLVTEFTPINTESPIYHDVLDCFSTWEDNVGKEGAGNELPAATYFEMSSSAECLTPDGGWRLEPKHVFHQRLKERVFARKFALTSSKYMAMVPNQAEKGDVVAILFGSDYPVILRPITINNETLNFKVIGTCYIRGFMYGEIFESSSNKNRDVRTFILE